MSLRDAHVLWTVVAIIFIVIIVLGLVSWLTTG
jgi:hypothetical protein